MKMTGLRCVEGDDFFMLCMMTIDANDLYVTRSDMPLSRDLWTCHSGVHSLSRCPGSIPLHAPSGAGLVSMRCLHCMGDLLRVSKAEASEHTASLGCCSATKGITPRRVQDAEWRERS